MSDPERIRQERDFYLRLLDLGGRNELEPLLAEALSLVVELTDASQGFLELRDARTHDAWSMTRSCSDADVADIRARISRGIIAEALASGTTVVTAAALLDERFLGRQSVISQRIGAVLCAPIGGPDGLGVLYLEGRRSANPFGEDDRRNAEVFARHLAPLADRLLARRQIEDRGDATRELRERYRLEEVIGRSPALAAALQQAMLAAPLDLNVLLTGDSGTGKSQLARAIHANSPRAQRPFVEINCGALPQNLIESELFGARAGAHSEARRDIQGKVSAAEGGTLFLDEVGEIPFDSQSKLLQLLQSRTYFPLGATAPVTADVRVIAASNVDLEAAVRERRFRQDLLFRLQVLPVRMPTLGERRGDLPDLARTLLASACARNRLPLLELSPNALREIEEAEWPGNVRQLENFLTAAVVRAAGSAARRVEAAHVFTDRTDRGDEGPEHLTLDEHVRRLKRDLLKRTLDELDWNIVETGRRLDIARSYVYTLINLFGLKRD